MPAKLPSTHRTTYTTDFGYLGEIDLVLEFDYEPEEKETGPTFSSGGEPGSPASANITGITLEDGTSFWWIWDYLSRSRKTELQQYCCEQVEEGGDEDEPDRDPE
jgi:hypothetical protein